jgi:hypothetical protein
LVERRACAGELQGVALGEDVFEWAQEREWGRGAVAAGGGGGAEQFFGGPVAGEQAVLALEV